MADTYDMDDAALDAVLEQTYTGDEGQTEYINENDAPDESGSEESGSEDVSPSDDVEVGQSEDEDSDTDVDQTEYEDEDPEDSLSTDDDDDGEEVDGAGTDDESDDVDQEAESESTDESDEEPLAFQPLRADGKEYPIESMQELYTLASKGINSDRKWQESSEGRKVAATLKKNGLSADDINLLVDLKAGNPQAIASLLKSAKLDPLDIDVDALDGNYTPKDYSTGDFEMQLDEVVSRVKTQPRYQESVNVITEQWDEQSKSEFYKNPKILELLNVDMQVGQDGSSMYDKVAPLADKMKALDTGVKRSDLEYYQMAGAKIIDAMQKGEASTKEAETKKAKAKTSKQESLRKKKKAAASSGNRGGGSKKVTDVTELSDEDLDKLLEETS